MMVFNYFQIRTLLKKFDRKLFKDLDVKEKKEKYVKECKIRKDINHDSIRKLERAFIKRSLKLKRIGHFYLEKVTCNLRESTLYTTHIH